MVTTPVTTVGGLAADNRKTPAERPLTCGSSHNLLCPCDVISKGRPKTTAVDHIELSEKLNRLTSSSSIGSSLPSLSSLHSTSSASTMPSAKIADGSCISLPALKTPSFQKTDEDRQRDVVRYREMLQKRAELEETLIERLTELKAICVQEGELTGAMPDEMQNALMPGEDVPRLKRRVGTSFSIPEELIRADKSEFILIW
ncbi:unnamed protein product [Caenorhabditis auriculariae]|uniref:Cytohesin Ubiquitin Protein Inducing domain-containing protein n=1 Tax=Caenorhabditis auriculariae TaxID=2777116 RepID=A0A8S1HA15_9PELO|nr:unnamed protein product [Caenorhabditis auriculariae]